MSKIVRINEESLKNLALLKKLTGEKQGALIEKAIRTYTREMYIRQANEEILAFRKKNKKAFQKLQEEIREWDRTIADGSEDWVE